ncbi:MAG: response regulator [Magnetococcales bacterium]|nr:response regulator [Magnetococcales bacterium]
MAHPTLLLVDDEPVFLDGLKTGLALLNHHPLTASSATRALELLAQHDIQVMVTDLRMPAMNGLELIQEIRGLRPNLACIVLTGHGDLHEYDAAMALGVKHFLKKPPDLEQLHQYIGQIMAEKAPPGGRVGGLLKRIFSRG